MKKLVLILFLLSGSVMMFSQDENVQFKLDSIIKEADLLYRYEKAVWNSSDLIMTDKKLKRNFGGYIVSHSGDTITVTYFDKNQMGSIARYGYDSDLIIPSITHIEPSALTSLEQELLDIKTKILMQIADEKYEVTIPQDFDPNFVLIKEKTEFKLYILMGTMEYGVIPFGNDYLFRADKTGAITSWKKFHSRMIPAYSKTPDGEKVISVTHSHLKTTPYITATDICTFRLYGELCGMPEFTVLCTATGKYYTYNVKTNSIEITGP